MILKRPMLAVACEDVSKINFPVLVSPKLDGIRMLVKDGVCYSRSMKPIPSSAVQEKFGKEEYNGFDGELVYGSPVAPNVFNVTTSFCMSHNIPEGLQLDEIKFYVFDRWDLDYNFQDRYLSISEDPSNNVHLLQHKQSNDSDNLLQREKTALESGFEGIMVRSLDGKYKQGRSTLKQGWLLKVKRFKDDEATITGFVERMHNTNEAELDERGYTKRSTAKAGMVGTDTLGALVAEHSVFGEIEIGTGFNDKQRQEIWDNQENYLGKLVKFKYFEVGMSSDAYTKPRFPVYLGIRDPLDLGD